MSLLLELLAEQQELSAVEQFSAAHSAGSVADRYRALLPAAPPGPGEQYAFDVDLDACTGCKSCVVACRSLNGLDADESWRSVGFLHAAGDDRPGYRQTITTGCHHCVEPACMAGCPVDAYRKDPVTGVVFHLDDQCIGCSYCTLTCPYEVPRYNSARGIVRKCDMCQGRLAVGEAPACVQACPNGAISITLVRAADAVAAAQGSTLVPGAPASSLTAPTTRYRTTRGELGDVLAADSHDVHPAQSHPPLAVMLVLTQLSVGALLADLVLDSGHPMLALAVGILALLASVLHLGRPLFAWRAVIGFRHSWLSREVVAFGGFAGLAGLSTVTPSSTAEWAAATVGVAGVLCSALLYAATGRRWWRMAVTLPRFAATTAAGGLAVAGLTEPRSSVAAGLAIVLGAKLAWEATWLLGGGGTARLLRGALLVPAQWRFVLGGLALVAAVGGAAAPTLWLAAPAVVALVAGELVERSLFFRAVAGPRMPGELA